MDEVERSILDVLLDGGRMAAADFVDLISGLSW
jgi:hypothetical protein